ncbi:MAG: hypothetical protein AAF546_04810 [Verrucomicrobiota bacterium]
MKVESKALYFFSLLMILVAVCVHAEKEEAPSLSIKEALDLALDQLPEGKEITSIALQEYREDEVWYFAEYDEKVIPYESKEMNANGDFIPVTKFRKVKIGMKIGMDGNVLTDQLSSTASIPRRRVIIPSK